MCVCKTAWKSLGRSLQKWRDWLFQKTVNKNHCCVAGYFSLVLKQPEDSALKWWFCLLCSPWSLGSLLCSPVSVCHRSICRPQVRGLRTRGVAQSVRPQRACQAQAQLSGSSCGTALLECGSHITRSSVSRKLSRSVCENLPISTRRQLMQRKSKRKVKNSTGPKANRETL